MAAIDTPCNSRGPDLVKVIGILGPYWPGPLAISNTPPFSVTITGESSKCVVLRVADRLGSRWIVVLTYSIVRDRICFRVASSGIAMEGMSAAGRSRKAEASAKASSASRVLVPGKSACHLDNLSEVTRSVISRPASCLATFVSRWWCAAVNNCSTWATVTCFSTGTGVAANAVSPKAANNSKTGSLLTAKTSWMVAAHYRHFCGAGIVTTGPSLEVCCAVCLLVRKARPSMTRLMFFWLLFCIPTVVSGQSAQEQPAATLRTFSSLVVVDVVVTDAHQNPVHQLTTNDFTVLEDGPRQDGR